MVQSAHRAVQGLRQPVLQQQVTSAKNTSSSVGTKQFSSLLSKAIVPTASASSEQIGSKTGNVSSLVAIRMDLPVNAQPPSSITPVSPMLGIQPSPVVTDPNAWQADRRDAVPSATGQVTASGAPLIAPTGTPIQNQWGYTGAAAQNPYFTTPSNPLQSGYVTGFDNWFTQVNVTGTSNAPEGGSYTMNRSYGTTQEGAQEALRLVQAYSPNATMVSTRFGAGSPYQADKLTYQIQLPNGTQLNAGLILNSYYNGGAGVTPLSDQRLQLDLKAS